MVKKIALILFWIIFYLIIIELGLRLIGYMYIARQEYANWTSFNKKHDYTILALGESTTQIGGKSSWPSQLEKILNEKLSNQKFAVVNKGESGTNSYKILSELEGNLNKYQPQIVITMIGVNDGAFPDLRVYDESIAVALEESPQSKQLPLKIDELKIYKFLNVLRVIIKQKIAGSSLTYTENPMFAYNYKKIKQMVLAHGARLVAVQYPTRNTDELKSVIGVDNVIFVDNEKSFNEAIKNGGYENIFIDRFAENFGHATAKGNFLLSSNIADTLLKEIFSKRN